MVAEFKESCGLYVELAESQSHFVSPDRAVIAQEIGSIVAALQPAPNGRAA